MHPYDKQFLHSLKLCFDFFVPVTLVYSFCIQNKHTHSPTHTFTIYGVSLHMDANDDGAVIKKKTATTATAEENVKKRVKQIK